MPRTPMLQRRFAALLLAGAALTLSSSAVVGCSSAPVAGGNPPPVAPANEAELVYAIGIDGMT